ncbi:hypothetical protein ACSBR2_013171 [Camellia fascicularis]
MYGWTPLHYAAQYGHVQRAKQLLELDKYIAYVIVDKDDEKTTLHVVATHGHVGVMEEIISQCPDCWEMVNGKDQNILHVAVENRKRRVINFILKNASLNKLMNLKDADGNTPIHHLIDARLFATDLIQHPRANKTVFNKKNWNPLDVTVYSKIMSITKVYMTLQKPRSWQNNAQGCLLH